MAQLFKIASKGFEWTLFLLFMFPLFPLKSAGILVLPLVIFALLSFISSNAKVIQKQELFLFLFFALIPAYYAVELFYANDVQAVWSIVQRKMGLLFIPLGLFLASSSGIKLKHQQLFLNFALSVTLQVVKVSLYFLFGGLNKAYLDSGGFAFAFRTSMEDLVNLHPTYFSLLITMAIFIFFIPLLSKRNVLKSIQFWLIVFVIVWLTSFLFLLAARMVLIAFMLAALLTIWKVITSTRMRIRIITMLAVLFGIAIFSFPSFSDRFKELVDTKDNSTSVRYTIYECDKEIAVESGLFGVGVESLQNKLNSCYESQNMPEEHLTLAYNTHNEYFNFLCGKGVLGLLLFCGLLVYMFMVLRKKPLFLPFFLSVLLVSLTENILERQIGVFFVALFGMSLMGYEIQAKEKENFRTH